MNSREAESQIEATIEELENRGDHQAAALLRLDLFHTKGYLPELKKHP
jgi:hypothetical protein